MPRKVTCDNPRLRLPSSRFANIGTPRWQCSYLFPFNLDLAHAQPKTGDLSPLFLWTFQVLTKIAIFQIMNQNTLGFFDVFHMFTVLYRFVLPDFTVFNYHSWDTAPPSGPVIESSHASSVCRLRTKWLILWGSLSFMLVYGMWVGISWE